MNTLQLIIVCDTAERVTLLLFQLRHLRDEDNKTPDKGRLPLLTMDW